MVFFPVTSRGERGKFLQIIWSEQPSEYAEYVAFGPDGPRDGGKGVSIDKCIAKDPNSFAAVTAACSATYRTGGFLTVYGMERGDSLVGASLGLAAAVELYVPGAFADVAFTGYITDFSNRALSFGVKEVDSIDKKIAMARERGIVLIVPGSEEVRKKAFSHKIVSPKNIIGRPPGEMYGELIGTAETMMEAMDVARFLRSAFPYMVKKL